MGFSLDPLRRLFGIIASAGTIGYPPDTQRRLKILNMIAVLIVVTTLIFAIQQTNSDYERMKPVIWMNGALAAVAMLVPLAHRINDIAGALLIATAELFALLFFTVYLGRSAGTPMMYAIFAAAPFVVFGLERIYLVLTYVGAAAALHLYSWFNYPRSSALLSMDDKFLNANYVQVTITTFGLIAASVYYAFRLAERAKAETESVLRNVLPESVVERLKAKPQEAIADGFSNASVMFADISGFVRLARSLGPDKTVALLNQVVTSFDALAEKHGVEKIKTIGDAYMVASGVPVPRKDHVSALADMALQMLVATKHISQSSGIPLDLRIGIASGPLMAGVIGKRKFSYDVWGDPVNLASRLESTSSPGRIAICPQSKAELDHDFNLEARGAIEVKGVGEVQSWYLVGRRQV